jgi:RNA polymerase sigma-70 factor (sigma-E family)
VDSDEHKASTHHGRDFDGFAVAVSPRLLRAAFLLTGDAGRAEDLVQEALARTYLRWDRIVDENPIGYVHKVMLNGYIDWWRRSPWREQSVHPVPDSAATGADPADRYATTQSLLQALDGLTRRERAVVVLRYFDDLTESQIADTLSIAPGTVKSTSARALTNLRTSPHLQDDPDSTTITRKGPA